jgi:hypothetical protein
MLERELGLMVNTRAEKRCLHLPAGSGDILELAALLSSSRVKDMGTGRLDSPLLLQLQVYAFSKPFLLSIVCAKLIDHLHWSHGLRELSKGS